MIITVDDERVAHHIDEAQSHSPTLRWKICLHAHRDGWLALHEEIQGASAEFERPTGDEASVNGDQMLIYFTSGTNGLPKMVQHDFSYPLGHILTAKYWQNVVPGGLHFTLADTGWAKAAWGKIYGQWIAGSAVMAFDLERFDPQRLLNVIANQHVTTFCAPPTVYRMLVQEDLRSYHLDDLVYCCVAGEPLNPETFKQFYQGTGLKLYEGYGQTETTVAVANYPWFEPKPGSMGKPSAGYRIDLINEDGESCKPGEEGQIIVHTEQGKPVGMFNGYYRDEALSNLVWERDIYYTGDVAYRDADGFYWFVGRADDLIKTSGYRVSPFEVESVLLEHPDVVECAVTAVPDEMRGQIIKATVVLREEKTTSDTFKKELQEHVKVMTAPYKYPRIIEFVSELPKTISGKILRRELRRQSIAQSAATPEAKPTLPETDKE